MSTKITKKISKNSTIAKPNSYPINAKNVIKWLEQSDPSIRHIANEFILKTTYINHNMFLKTYKKAIEEMISILDINVLQFFISIDDKNKSNYWIMQIIEKYVNSNKYKIIIVSDFSKIDPSYPVIIADDASYSGSQMANTIEDNFQRTKLDIFILIPFMSNTAIDTIKKSYSDNLNEGSIMFLDKSIYIMKPIYELIDKDKIELLFSYYTHNPKYIREYPIYFDHKVADSYSSFPLIYTYGIIPNNYNKQIIHDIQKKRLPIKNIFDKLERIPLLKNCTIDIPYNIMVPPCPQQPYKLNFKKLTTITNKTNTI
jgi:hypothetical protein